jgi:hypothetical protein
MSTLSPNKIKSGVDAYRDLSKSRNKSGHDQSSADSSAETAGALREAQNNQEDSSQGSEGGDFNASKRGSKRERTKRLRKANLKEVLDDQEKSLSAGASKWLQSAWRNLISSWGFSFFYVYVHLFLQSIFGKKVFVPLGSEWFDRAGITVKKRDEMGRKIHLTETMGVGFITLVIIFAVIANFSILALLLEVVSNPLGTLVKIL